MTTRQALVVAVMVACWGFILLTLLAVFPGYSGIILFGALPLVPIVGFIIAYLVTRFMPE